jgi:hypothetical protein
MSLDPFIFLSPCPCEGVTTGSQGVENWDRLGNVKSWGLCSTASPQYVRLTWDGWFQIYPSAIQIFPCVRISCQQLDSWKRYDFKSISRPYPSHEKRQGHSLVVYSLEGVQSSTLTVSLPHFGHLSTELGKEVCP